MLTFSLAQTNFYLLHLSLLREYLDLEFSSLASQILPLPSRLLCLPTEGDLFSQKTEVWVVTEKTQHDQIGVQSIQTVSFLERESTRFKNSFG
jgi:hypothetical protein